VVNTTGQEAWRLTARALVGGEFTGVGDQALIEVSLMQGAGAARPVRSDLGRHLYAAGLSAEFADAALQGLLLTGSELRLASSSSTAGQWMMRARHWPSFARLRSCTGKCSWYLCRIRK
jgi:hypothetical protein